MNKNLITLGLILALTGCSGGGGGGSDDSTTPTPPPTTDVSTALSGTIDSVSGSSISINGLTLSTSGAKITYAAQTWAQPLEAGMQVDIKQTNNAATEIVLNPLLSGSLDDNGTDWLVNGVKVESSDSSSWVAGEDVLVFGYYQADNSISTQHLTEQTAAMGIIEVEGRVSALDTNAKTFTLNNLNVDYSGAFVEGALTEGAWVEVYGSVTGTDFIATEVEIDEPDTDFNEIDSAEYEGVVVFYSAASGLLELDRQRQVYVTATTRFEDGTSSNLIAGAFLEAEYKLNNGRYEATVIDFETDGDYDNGGNTPTTSTSFQLSGTADWNGTTLTVNGTPFVIDSQTRFDDGLNTGNLDGKWVSLDGITQNGQNLVRELEPEDEFNEMELSGVVASGTLWNYATTDGSLNSYNNQWVDVDCRFDGTYLSQCRKDD